MLPNEFPRVHNVPYRIAILTDLPHSIDEHEGRHLSGYGGKLLERLLNIGGILRNACLICAISQEGTVSGTLDAYTSPSVVSGMSQLKLDLTEFNPHITILLC